MEKQYKIKTNDNFIIYGTLNSCVNTNKLIIFVHGLTGNQHEHQYYNAPAYFNPNGYDTFRFDLYSPYKKARQISECSLEIHSRDLLTIIDKFNKKYDEIYLIGHSFGCQTIMNSNTKNIKKIIYWDPSRGMKSLKEKNATYDSANSKYILHWGLEITLSSQMVDDWKDMTDLEKYVEMVTSNSAFIFAGNYKLYEAWKNHLINFPVRVVPGATHRFIEEGVLEKLYDYTLELLTIYY